jgi:alcohol dehydrogenase class IV
MEKESLGALRKFVVPEFIFGWGARALLGQYAKNFAFRRPLLVTDAGVLAAGWAEKAASMLLTANIPFSLFSRVSPNPRDHEVMAGAEFFDRAGCDSLVAVGGGSAIDTAKGIGIIISNGGHILDYEGVDKIPLPIPPLLCIPTTAGSSADVSQFAIILNSAEKRKIAIISKAIVPDVSLIDPETSSAMPSSPWFRTPAPPSPISSPWKRSAFFSSIYHWSSNPPAILSGSTAPA